MSSSTTLGTAFPLLLALYEVAVYLSNDAYLPALPFIAQDLQTSHSIVELTLTAWFLGSTLPQVGPLSDRIGRRSVLLIGGLIFLLSTLGCALAPNSTLLLIFRVIQGACIPSMVIPGYSTIHAIFDREKAIHTLALMGSITILAPAFGPLLGAILLSIISWRGIFVFLCCWTFLVLSGLWQKMPETAARTPNTLSQRKPLIAQYKAVLSNRSFLLYNLTSQCLFAAMIAWITVGPFILMEQFHYKPLGFGCLQSLVFGSFILSTHCVKQFMQKLSLRRIVHFGLSLSLVGGSLAALTSRVWPDKLWPMIGSMALMASGFGLILPILNRLGIESSQEPLGTKVAVSAALNNLGGMLGSALMSLVYQGTLFSLGITLLCLSSTSVFIRLLDKNKLPDTSP